MMPPDFSYGVEYSPSRMVSTTLTVDKLKSRGITYIRLQWVDFTNTVRYRVIPISYFMKLLDGPRPGVGVTKVTMGLVYLITAPGISPMGEYLYAPDLSTLKICPYAPGQASVMGWFQEKAPITGLNGVLTVEVDLCPRSLLKRVVEEAKAKSDLDFLVGFETEFILLKSTNPVEASNIHAWAASNALLSGSVEAIVMDEIAEGVQKSGIELQMYHAEAAPGQYEVVTGPLTPLEAADALIHTREIVVNIASKHGLRATFAPRVYMTSAGSAAHTHISIHSKSRSPKPAQGLSQYESSFLAGLMEHLPALPALTLPIPASYKRMMDGVWSGGTYVCWGTENREAPIRLTSASSPSGRRFEMRFVDGTANPYLALAGILAAGHEGVKTNKKLNVLDCPGPQSAAQMDDNGRKNLGITQRMPLSWEEARENIANNVTFKGIFGDHFLDRYLAVNKTLGEALAMDDSEQAALTRLVEFY